MIRFRKGESRGHANHGWLETYHTFSFADYQDPENMGFRSLRVINDDRVEPSEGFETHPHENMEIVTYVIEGEIEHRDSIGNEFILRAGDVQRMTAGTGVSHSEFNPSPEKPLHLIQVWILPEKNGLEPSYEQKRFYPEDKKNQLKLIVSPSGKNGSIKIHQDVQIYASVLPSSLTLKYENPSGRHAWIQLVKGRMNLNGRNMKCGDGAAVSEHEKLTFESVELSEFILFDLG